MRCALRLGIRLWHALVKGGNRMLMATLHGLGGSGSATFSALPAPAATLFLLLPNTCRCNHIYYAWDSISIGLESFRFSVILERSTMSKDEEETRDEEELPDAPLENAVNDANARQKRQKSSQTTLTQATLRKPVWTYLHLVSHTSPPSSQPLDTSTARLHLTSALKQYLGLTGEAIPIDFLKLQDRDLWVRVPREDSAAVVAALGGWVGGSDGASVGWKVQGRDEWLPRLSGGDGMDLFGG
jgi:ribonuclease P/MRP protein subunit POP8